MVSVPESFGRVADQEEFSVDNLFDNKEREQVAYTTHGSVTGEELR